MFRSDLLRPWRHSPLRRRSDVAEGWLVLVTAVLIALGAPAAGLAAAQAVDDGTEQARQGRHTVSAVLAENPPPRIGVDVSGGAGTRIHATVRWTAADGSARTGVTTVAPDLRAGDRTTAWVDRHGALVRDPVTPRQATGESIALGTVAGTSAGLLLLGAQHTGRALLNRRRYAQWEREWAAEDPRWGQRAT
ncbi:Rv1733c family protein [Streptomyces tubercidicus]|uniref:Rv1733c family protein n=1 Tax=Streptomyces tubercidicus TaxID=47759 RepID=UPI00369AACE8